MLPEDRLHLFLSQVPKPVPETITIEGTVVQIDVCRDREVKRHPVTGEIMSVEIPRSRHTMKVREMESGIVIENLPCAGFDVGSLMGARVRITIEALAWPGMMSG